MRRSRSLLRLTGLAALCAAAGSFVAADAAASWPPAENATPADMVDPANWPNDPDYAYGPDNNGQWNYYSFIPEPSGSIKPRPEETASGMSIDLAWRYTIGDPRTVILITDSGIEWDKDDLLDKAWLNFKELANHKPTGPAGAACGDLDPAKNPNPDGTLPDAALLAGLDCNGDGILTVSDYKDTETLEPPAAGSSPRGDKNANGKLDAGDLILNFSDGIDDDQNGYVDDISGWDWMKNDNDPYDDTRYGHGTGEAGDSVSAANNGIGSAGGCPLCRFIPGRVGDSFIADVQAFGQAVIYATDNGASIVQCALGTINNTSFAQSALDYAYSKKVLVVTSMADENARHHNMPAANNHTLPVHAIQYGGSSATKATTYFAFHPCSNFGGQNLLSASGTGCSSEATGQLSGISGLLFSEALEEGLVPRLSANEAMQLFFANTDDIDVPESRQAESSYKWSQTGFDQRFGYGRVNANLAIEALRAGRIPPEVDVTAPKWFEVLYKDQVTAPVEILGTVAAKRATSYDYLVEWAPGVQPTEGEFVGHVITEQKNIDPATVIGADGMPLAALDIRNVDPTHERDIDSPNGENDYTITVRVRAVAHYGGAIGDVPGEMRRTYYVYSDPTLVKGFPIYVGDSGEGNPKMADLDGDGVRDLVYPTSGGLLHAYKVGASGPVELPGFPFRSNAVDGLLSPAPTPTTPVYLAAPAYASGAVDASQGREAFTSAPAIADLDGDGKNEIVASTWTGTIYVVGSNGELEPGWPIRLPEVPSCSPDPSVPPVQPCMSTETRIARGAFAAPVVIDLDKDGKLDIIQAAFDGKIYAYSAAGAPVAGFPVALHYQGSLSEEPKPSRILTTPAVADMNGDGVPDLLVGSNEKLGAGGQSGAIYLIDGRGNGAPGGAVLPGWPITMTSFELFPLIAEGVPNAGVIGDFDGVRAAVMHGNATLPVILPADPGAQNQLNATPINAIPQREDPYKPGTIQRGVDPSSVFGELTKAAQPNTMLPLFAQPSLGDVDQDGVPDVVAAGGSINLAINLQSQSGDTGLKGDHLLAVWSGKTGKMMPASPFTLEDYSFFNSQTIADLDGDDYPEVIAGTGGYFLHAIDGGGREPAGWPKFTGQWIIPTPAVGDIDGAADGKLEIVTGTRDGFLYAWHTEATEESIIEWESFHHDNQNTGYLGTPLGQGGKQKAAQPLTAEVCLAQPVPDEPKAYAVGGGCGLCTTSPASPWRADAVLAALGLAGLAGARRRRRGARRG